MTDLTPAVEIVSGRPVTSSLRVAEHFGKQHKHVVRDIRRIIQDVSKEFAEPNFGPCNYIGENGKQLPMYLLTKDGFLILAMGYTGKDAMRLKEAYIRRFNEMEAELAARHAQEQTERARPKTLDNSRSTVEDRELINLYINSLHKVTGRDWKFFWRRVHEKFHVKSAFFLRKSDMPAVEQYLRNWLSKEIQELGLDWEQFPAEIRKDRAAECDLTDHYAPLEMAVRLHAKYAGMTYGDVWSQVCSHCGVTKIQDIEDECIWDALNWIQERTDVLVQLGAMHSRRMAAAVPMEILPACADQVKQAEEAISVEPGNKTERQRQMDEVIAGSSRLMAHAVKRLKEYGATDDVQEQAIRAISKRALQGLSYILSQRQ
jgi:Rha family phage regulatory protein